MKTVSATSPATVRGGALLSSHDLICARLGKVISSIARERIKEIAEGHPVSTEHLVRNSNRINFDELYSYKQGLDSSRSEHVDEMLKRVIGDILIEMHLI